MQVSKGDKVTFQGIAQIVTKVDGDQVTIRQARVNRLYGKYWNTVAADQLSPWAPAPKVSAHAKTCQICGRAIHAAKGIIAHHGYQRPGDGEQTASCYGARHEPFEVSRDTLGMYIEMLKSQLAACIKRQAELATGTAELVRLETVTDAQGFTVWQDRALRIPQKKLNTYKPGDAKYAWKLACSKAEVAGDIASVDMEIRVQTIRFEEWKPAKVDA